jgi:hypothetical protein
MIDEGHMRVFYIFLPAQLCTSHDLFSTLVVPRKQKKPSMNLHNHSLLDWGPRSLF